LIDDIKILEQSPKIGFPFFYYEASNVETSISQSNSFSDFVETWMKDLEDKVVNFRNTGKPLCFVFHPGGAHWIAVVMTKNGMFIADSLNTDRRKLNSIVFLYDFILLPSFKGIEPVHKDEKKIEPAESGGLTYIQALLSVLKQKLQKLLEMIVQLTKI
jgi:hypothetical protein